MESHLHSGGRGPPSLGTLEVMPRKSPDTDGHLSPFEVPFHPRGTWYVRGGGRIPGTWIECCSGGASLCGGFHKWDLKGGLLYWETRKMSF